MAYKRLDTKLWFKPLMSCVLSIMVVVLAYLFGDFLSKDFVPGIELSSLEKLLSIMATSLLPVATFAVSSMVSAYASASSTASPRSFSLVIADDNSQNALSMFVGAFIFSVVALIAIKNEFFSKGGTFILFSMTLFVFVMVVWVFVRWIDSIARLGRLGETIKRVYSETNKYITQKDMMGIAKPLQMDLVQQIVITPPEIGYLNAIDKDSLQDYAKEHSLYVEISAYLGDFITPKKAIAYVGNISGNVTDIDSDAIRKFFIISSSKNFKNNPLFGLGVLSEISAKALSPGINDNGTAVQVVHVQTKLLIEREQVIQNAKQNDSEQANYSNLYQKIQLPDAFLDAAFSETILYGAGNAGVSYAVAEALVTLHDTTEDEQTKQAIIKLAKILQARTELDMALDEDKKRISMVTGHLLST